MIEVEGPYRDLVLQQTKNAQTAGGKREQ
jgi:hypothetical protein